MKKTIELQANATAPHGATIKLTVEYRSKNRSLANKILFLFLEQNLILIFIYLSI